MNRFQPKQNPEPIDIWNTQLPISSAWGIYARLSTPGQVIKSTESTEMQTDDLIQWLIDRNVQAERILLFDADLGVSGTLRIDQRTGLQEMVAQIQADDIKAVLVYQVSRLFRDETGIQYNTFADICKQHSCILATADGTIFNFNNPMHMKMFRFLGEMAAEYIPQHVKGVMHANRTRKARKGFYVGLGAVPVGYIVDYCKDSPTYKKFIPYEPHARVIRFLFERYFALCGNINALCRELEAIPVLFPSFGSEVDKRSLVRFRCRKVPGGYHISRHGLEEILKNPVYLGWWMVNGELISKTNHQPLVDEELFLYAFTRLSTYTIDGQINEERICLKPQRRFCQRETEQQYFGGLLKDRITTLNGSVHVHPDKGNYRYVRMLPSKVIREADTGIKVSIIDTAFTDRFFERLKETHDFDQYHKWLAEETSKQEALVVSVTEQLQQIDKQQEAILDERLAIRKMLREISNEQERAKAEAEMQPELERLQKRSTGLEKPRTELLAKLPKPDDNQKIVTARKFADFQTELCKLIPVWDLKPFSVRCEFVNLFVRNAILEVVATHWIKLTLVWSHPKWDTDTLYIFRPRGAMPNWTEEEEAMLQTAYAWAHRDDLLAILPEKSWVSIRQKALLLGLEREGLTQSFIPKHVTWSDWQFMQEFGIRNGDRATKCVTMSIHW